MKLWHNGELKNDTDPLFPFADRIRLGDGVFDTMLAVEGKLIHPQLHFERLLHNASLLEIKVELSSSALEQIAQGLLTENNCVRSKYAVNTLIARGSGARGLMPPENPEPQIVMRAAPVPEDFPPVHAIIAETVRRNEGSPLSQIKSCNYGDNILALLEAREKGANEAIMLNNAGHVTCASASNIFMVRGGKLFTPPLSDGVLDGITRRLLIERYNVSEKSLTAQDLKTAEGLVLTNSIRGAVPISTLEGQTLSPPGLEIDKDFHLL